MADKDNEIEINANNLSKEYWINETPYKRKLKLAYLLAYKKSINIESHQESMVDSE